MIHHFCDEVDFGSIGSNDETQYPYAVDCRTRVYRRGITRLRHRSCGCRRYWLPLRISGANGRHLR
ncbi:putative PEP-binding protein [Escherichia coli]